jgi:uncharacterized RDD family membrane protein YckC
MLDYDLIETPENVELERRLAGIGSRFLAGLLDNLVLIGVYLVLFLLLLAVWRVDVFDEDDIINLASDVAIAFLILVFFIIYWGYFVFFELRGNGQTLGKRRLKIRVVREGGGPMTFTDTAIRNLLRPVDGFAFYGIAGLFMFFSKKVQRLGDMAAGTVVITEQSRDYSARSNKRLSATWEAEVTAEALRTTGLTPQEYNVLRNYWARRSQFTMEARARVLPRLLGPILERTGRQLEDQSLEALEEYVRKLVKEGALAEQEEAKEEQQQSDQQ